MVCECFADQRVEIAVKIGRSLQRVGKLRQLLRYNRIEHHIRPGDGKCRTEHAEFKFVAGECERRRAVAVRGILRETRQDVHADLHDLCFTRAVRRFMLDCLKDTGQLVAQKH